MWAAARSKSRQRGDILHAVGFYDVESHATNDFYIRPNRIQWYDLAKVP